MTNMDLRNRKEHSKKCAISESVTFVKMLGTNRSIIIDQKCWKWPSLHFILPIGKRDPLFGSETNATNLINRFEISVPQPLTKIPKGLKTQSYKSDLTPIPPQSDPRFPIEIGKTVVLPQNLDNCLEPSDLALFTVILLISISDDPLGLCPLARLCAPFPCPWITLSLSVWLSVLVRIESRAGDFQCHGGAASRAPHGWACLVGPSTTKTTSCAVRAPLIVMEDMKESHGSGEEGGANANGGNNGGGGGGGGGLRGGPNSGAGGPGGGGGNLHYTIPGILHFLQHEWSRFEMDRSQWDVEKAELQVTRIMAGGSWR